MDIFIPTRGRTHHPTYDALVEVRWEYPVTFVVPQGEEEYFEHHNLSYIVSPYDGIGATRQFIVENSVSDKVVMVDDDLNAWAVRKPDGHYRKATPQDILAGFQKLDLMLTDFAHVGIGPRLFANVKPDVDINGRMMRCVGYRRDILLARTQGFATLMEDLEMTVQLIRAGYTGATLYDIVQDQPASNAPGGCSLYRTAIAQEKAALQFYEWHRGYVSLTSKVPKTGWFDGLPRTDVSIRWSKLMKDFDPQPIGVRSEERPKVMTRHA